ncbi:hypothetical protein KA068_02825 [Candidatus Saccharibacteria bacterium]|nr:hypothetical protein [Candidatus Saccharibacteria bacterium]
MGLFSRNKATQTTLPAELSEYYQAERRERKGLAWLLTLFTLLVTAALVVALFLGGRWLYRKVRNERTTVTPTASVEQQTDSDSATTPVSGSEDQSSSQAEVNTGDNDQGTTDEPNSAVSESTEQATTNPSTQSNNVDSSNSTQALVNTGPSELLPVFVMFMIAGYLSSIAKLQTRKD